MLSLPLADSTVTVQTAVADDKECILVSFRIRMLLHTMIQYGFGPRLELYSLVLCVNPRMCTRSSLSHKYISTLLCGMLTIQQDSTKITMSTQCPFLSIYC